MYVNYIQFDRIYQKIFNHVSNQHIGKPSTQVYTSQLLQEQKKTDIVAHPFHHSLT